MRANSVTVLPDGSVDIWRPLWSPKPRDFARYKAREVELARPLRAHIGKAIYTESLFSTDTILRAAHT